MGQTRNFARGEKVVAHKALDAILPSVAGVAHAGADDGLQVEGQTVLGAAGDIVQVKAQRPEEIPAADCHARFDAGDDPCAWPLGIDQFEDVLHPENRLGEPVERLQIAQAAAAFLDVGLDDERAVAIAVMAAVAFGLLGGEELDGALAAGLGEALLELVEQRVVAGDQAGVEQRGAHRDVAFGLREAIGDRARRVADLQAEIPQEVEHELHCLEDVRRGVARREEEQVDIAERREHPAAVTAGGGEGELLGHVVLFAGVIEQGCNQTVGELRQSTGGGQAGERVALELIAHIGLDAGEMSSEHAERRIARGRAGDIEAQGLKGLMQQGGGGLGGARQGGRWQHHADVKRSRAQTTTPAMHIW